jgi:predicted nucleic acid-binding protein
VTNERVAFEATVAVRAALGEDERAFEWVEAVAAGEADAIAPDLIWLEVANALAGYIRRGRMSLKDGRRALNALLSLPLRTTAAAELAAPSFVVALDRDLSVYDACYAVVAEAEGAVLVTADRQLARTANRCELLS